MSLNTTTALSHPLFTLQSMWETNLQSASSCQLERIDTKKININLLTAGTELIFSFSCVFYYHIMYHILNMLKIKCDIKSAGFENSWPPFCQIWIIFTHLKLWIASVRHWERQWEPMLGFKLYKSAYFYPLRCVTLLRCSARESRCSVYPAWIIRVRSDWRDPPTVI